MPSFLKNLAGGKAISGGALAPRSRRGNTAQVATYWSGGGGQSFMIATGGTENTYIVNGITYKSHTFTSNSNFIVTQVGDIGTVDMHLVGGGGGGGYSLGGGGGGGGARTENSVAVSLTTYPIVIGSLGYQGQDIGSGWAGGAGGTTSALSIQVGGGGGGTTNVQGGPAAPADGGGGGGGNINGVPPSANGSYGSAGGAGIAGQGGGNGGSAFNQPNDYRTGSNETRGVGGQGSTFSNKNGAAGGTSAGCGGGGGGIYDNVPYRGGNAVAGTVIIRYRIA